MLSTNGYRTFAMTKANAIARAKKAIANYQSHIDAGVSSAHESALRIFIAGQQEVIEEWKNERFTPGQW